MLQVDLFNAQNSNWSMHQVYTIANFAQYISFILSMWTYIALRVQKLGGGALGFH